MTLDEVDLDKIKKAKIEFYKKYMDDIYSVGVGTIYGEYTLYVKVRKNEESMPKEFMDFKVKIV